MERGSLNVLKISTHERCNIMKKRIIVATLIMAIITTWTSLATAASWYVDNQAAGSDTGVDWANAFTNVGTAVSTVWGSGANSGDTIYIRQADGAADYTENIIIGAGYTEGTNGSYNKVIGWTDTGYQTRPTLKSADARDIFSVGATNNSVARSYYEFSGLEFDSSVANGQAVDLYSTSSYITFTNNMCVNADFDADGGGSNNENTYHLLIQGNEFDANSDIRLRRGNDVQILENNMFPAWNWAIVLLWGGGNIVIRDNVIDCGTWGQGITAQSFWDVTVSGNYISTTGTGYGALRQDTQNGSDWDVYNNLIIDSGCTLGGDTGNALFYFNGDRMHIYNNTFHNAVRTDRVQRYIYVAGSSQNGVIFNNIFSDDADIGNTVGIYLASGATATVGYNDFWNITTAYSNVTSSGSDLYQDPSFRDIGADDFMPLNDTVGTSGSSLFSGVSAPGVDYHDNARGGAISIGAVEFPEPQSTIIVIK